MARARGIVVNIRVYSTSWQGWTHDDPGYYIKLMGHALKDEQGYSPNAAARVKDFICNVDPNPAFNSQGYRSSL
jgi:hypothetical protein